MPTTESLNPWIQAAHNYAPTEPDLAPVEEEQPTAVPGLVAAHGGAGATAWANILGGVDDGNVNTAASSPVKTVLVTRGSIDGIDAAKTAIALNGYTRFACVLLVPAMPGKTPRIISDEIKVLSGALPIVHVPWIPALLTHRASELTTSSVPPKELTKIITALAAVGVHFKGATS